MCRFLWWFEGFGGEGFIVLCIGFCDGSKVLGERVLSFCG